MVMNFPFAYGIRPYRILSCLFKLFFIAGVRALKKRLSLAFWICGVGQQELFSSGGGVKSGSKNGKRSGPAMVYLVRKVLNKSSLGYTESAEGRDAR